MEIEAQLQALREADLLREPKAVEAVLQRPIVHINGETLVAFNTNDYLGLSTHRAVIQAAIDATMRWGVGSTGSRLTSGNFTLHEQLEQQLAHYANKARAVVFNSGYDANLAVPTTIVQPQDVIFSDARNHASIIDGIRLSKRTYHVYRHRDIKHLHSLLAAQPASTRKFIFTDSVFSMDGTLAPLAAITALKKTFANVIIVVDDAHGTGVVPVGTRDIDIVIGTLSKAIGTSGGFIATSEAYATYLINHARSYIYTTALPAGVIAAASESLRIMTTTPALRDAVLARTAQLCDGLTALGIPFTGGEAPIVSVRCSSNAEALALAHHLQQARCFTTAIRPPTVQVPCVRITLCALHEAAHISQLLEALEVFYDEKHNDA